MIGPEIDAVERLGAEPLEGLDGSEATTTSQGSGNVPRIASADWPSPITRIRGLPANAAKLLGGDNLVRLAAPVVAPAKNVMGL